MGCQRAQAARRAAEAAARGGGHALFQRTTARSRCESTTRACTHGTRCIRQDNRHAHSLLRPAVHSWYHSPPPLPPVAQGQRRGVGHGPQQHALQKQQILRTVSCCPRALSLLPLQTCANRHSSPLPQDRHFRLAAHHALPQALPADARVRHRGRRSVSLLARPR